MIKTNKNIKKIQLLYQNVQSEENETIISKKEDSEKEQTNQKSDIYSTNIKSDITKTLIFILFAILVLFIAFVFTSESSFANNIREQLNISPIFLR